MAGTDNLIPLDSRDPETARKIRSEGGKARKRQKEERRTMREWAMQFGEVPVTITTPDGKQTRTTTLGNIVAAQMAKATRGDTKAAKFIADLLGEMVQNVQVEARGPLVVSSEEMECLSRWATKKK